MLFDCGILVGRHVHEHIHAEFEGIVIGITNVERPRQLFPTRAHTERRVDHRQAAIDFDHLQLWNRHPAAKNKVLRSFPRRTL